jgi:hypothetical protein
MTDLAHLMMSLSYTLEDPRVPETLRAGAAEIDRLTARVRELEDLLSRADSALDEDSNDQFCLEVSGHIRAALSGDKT